MSTAHLWAVGFDRIERAASVREQVTRLGERHCLVLLDTAVFARYADGSATLDDEPFVIADDLHQHGLLRFLVGLALAAPPLTGAAVRTFPCGVDAAGSAAIGISEEFIRETAELVKPSTSALFVLDKESDMAAILEGIRGLGGTVLKTTVDLERAKLIQSTLAAKSEKGH